MKVQAVIVLLAIMLGIFIPPSLPLIVSHDGHSTIGILDVCHQSTPALSSNGDMPCLTECVSHHLPLAQHNVAAIANPCFKPLLLALQDERPPQI